MTAPSPGQPDSRRSCGPARAVAWAALGLLIAGGALAASSPAGSEGTVSGEITRASAGDPPRIERIVLERQTVFPETTGSPLPWLLRATNRLHHRTMEGVIRNEILFSEGSPLDTLRLRESERLLRERRIFETVGITHQIESGRATVHVRTQDLWTLGLVLNYEKQANISEATIGLRDTNILGTGNYLYWTQTVSTDEDALYLAALVPRIARTRASLSLLYAEQGEGITRSVTLGRSHQTRFDRWGWEVNASRIHGRQRFFREGEETGVSPFRSDDFEAYIGRYPARRLEEAYGVGWIARVLSPRGAPESSVEGIDPPQAFESRRYGGPVLFAGFMQRRFVPARNLDRYGTIEDYPLGWSAHLTAGPNLRWRDDPGHAFSARAQFDGALSPLERIGAAAEITGTIFLQSDRSAGERLLRAMGTVGWQPDPRALTFAQTLLLVGRDRPATSVYYLGTDSGLRGFPPREIEARNLLLTTLEQRFWSGIEVAWVGFGGNLFVDTCLPSSGDRLAGNRLRTGWGGGLLLGLRKSSQKPVRIEVAWRTDRKASPTFSISTGSSLRVVPRVVLPPPTGEFAATSR